MNNLIVPPSPNWYIPDILVCTPDNTLIYGSKNDIVILSQSTDEEPHHVQILDRAHNQKVVCVDATIQWGFPNKWIVSSGEDGHVKLWDIHKLSKISSHDAHKQDQKDKLIGARFLTEDRILSVSENGNMYIWHPSNKEYTKLGNFFQMKVNISCFSPCPHATFITAFGLKNGLIVIANLKKNGTLLHKLRGHTNEILSLSWCPAPINIFPSNPNNYIKGTTPPAKFNTTVLKDTTNENYQVPENEKKDFVDSIKISDSDVKKTENSNENPSEEISRTNEYQVSEEENKATEIVAGSIKASDNDLKQRENSSENLPEKISENTEEHQASEDGKNEIGAVVDTIETLKNDEKKPEEKCENPNIESKEKKISVKKNPWMNLKFVDDEEIDDKEDTMEEVIPNFLEECEILRKKIESFSLDANSSTTKKETEKTETETTNTIKLSQEATSCLNQSLECKSGDSSIQDSNTKSIQNETAHPNVAKNIEEETNEMISTPSSRNVVAEETRKEYLLASSGKDSTINIWRAGTDGRLQSFFKLPDTKVKRLNSKDKNNLNWTIVKWVSPFILLTATKKGLVLKYYLPRPLDPKKQYSVVHNDHSSAIFAMAAHVPTLTSENWLNQIQDSTFWTFGLDMYLLNTDTDSKRHLTTLETFCALIQCLAQSPVDPSRVSLGLSNGTIKVWNMNEHNIRHFATKNYSPKICSKVSSLAWHPTNEMLLAFSSEEGTLGFLNTAHQSKVTWFKQTFSNKVHKIEWGPRGSDGKICLYATGNGQLKCFDPDDAKSDAVTINLFSDTVAYTFAWKLDYSSMLLSASNGKLIVFNPDFSIKATYYERKKIHILAWHPDSAISSDERVTKSTLVAGALDNVVYIYDFAELSTKDGVLDIENVPRIVLNGHVGPIRCMAWSQFDGNRLATAGEDGLANVWNITTQEILATFYKQNFEPIKSIIWSPVHEDELMCSTTNASLIVWKMSEYPAPLSEEVLSKFEQHTKNEKKHNAVKEDMNLKTSKKVKKTIKNTILPNLNTGTHDDTQKQVKILQELLEWKETGTMLTNGVPNIKQLFGTKEEAIKLLNGNEASHIEKGKYDAANMISFWKGDLQDSIKQAIDQRRVTPLLISLAPSVSLGMWQKACETYANQLEEKDDSDPLEIATYFMASQNIEKAVNILCEKEMFKEALVLAKCRFPHENIFVQEVLQQWASFSAYHGSLETAAQCYIALGKFEDAAKVLFRRSEIELLKFALDLAKKSQNNELIKAIEFRCKAFTQEETVDCNERSVEEIPANDDEVSEVVENLIKSFEESKQCEAVTDTLDTEEKIPNKSVAETSPVQC